MHCIKRGKKLYGKKFILNRKYIFKNLNKHQRIHLSKPCSLSLYKFQLLASGDSSTSILKIIGVIINSKVTWQNLPIMFSISNQFIL